MEPEQLFRLAAAAIELAEAVERYLESEFSHRLGSDQFSHDEWFELTEAFENYQHIRDKGD